MNVSTHNWFMSKIDTIRNEIVEHDVVDNWWLMPSWIPVTSLVVAYLIFVKYLGPKMMENRKPYNIKYIILFYNLIQTLYNAKIVSFTFYPGVVDYLLNHSCNPLSIEHPHWMFFCKSSYWYFISKIIDLLDTVFFVLRKKQSQVTFLHVYHHSMMVLTTWVFLRYFKGEQGILIGILNSLVHVVMYSYYFLAALGPRVQKYLWWKKYITKFQLLQFAIFCIQQVSLLVFNCNMPVVVSYSIFFQASLMSVLFGNFYYQAYIKKKQRVRTPEKVE